jgi:hypothetical protein
MTTTVPQTVNYQCQTSHSKLEVSVECVAPGPEPHFICLARYDPSAPIGKFVIKGTIDGSSWKFVVSLESDPVKLGNDMRHLARYMSYDPMGRAPLRLSYGSAPAIVEIVYDTAGKYLELKNVFGEGSDRFETSIKIERRKIVNKLNNLLSLPLVHFEEIPVSTEPVYNLRDTMQVVQPHQSTVVDYPLDTIFNGLPEDPRKPQKPRIINE